MSDNTAETTQSAKAGARRRSRRAVREVEYSGVGDIYRERWQWDSVSWGTHCVDCYPGNCPYKVYVRDGMVWREEPAAHFTQIEEGVPDNNPMGCQKGAAWSQQLYSPDRVLYPLKRIGERGEGRWKRISWEQALTEIADAVIDTIREEGPESIVREGTPEVAAVTAIQRFFNMIGGVSTDLDGSINDFATGIYMTFGKFNAVSEIGDWFNSELVLIWHMNPAYTRIPHYHFIAEARYHGAEVVSIAPDYNPSAIHSDQFLPIRPGTDAAFALAMCQVIIEEDLMSTEFVTRQTDLPLLVRTDNGRFLRGVEVDADEREDQFYWWDQSTGSLAAAPRDTLDPGEVKPALTGTFTAKLADGSEVELTTVFELQRQRLNSDYTPEQAAEVCGIAAENIRSLARRCAAKRTNIMMGYNSMKNYHGDLMERSMMLLLALTGNWGRHGTGMRCWSTGQLDGLGISMAKRKPGLEGAQEIVIAGMTAMQEALANDPTMTPELAVMEWERRNSGTLEQTTPLGENVIPTAFFWYYHCGYREIWNRREWGDPSMRRSFDDYVEEAIEEGGWGRLPELAERAEPRLLFECGNNTLRRARGGQTLLLEHLWPKLKLIVTVELRMSLTAMFSDIVLPAANHYEKVSFHIPTPHLMNATFSDRAAAPAGEAKSEWEIFKLLSKRISERAIERGFSEYRDWKGEQRSLADLGELFTLGGALEDEEVMWDDVLRDTTLTGTLPPGTDLETMRERGTVRFLEWGMSALAQAQASPISDHELHVPFRNHTELLQPYPTLTRRAQFYIDHPWFFEADEALPRHKEPPKMGGDHPLHLTSGHIRYSIHAMNMTNPVLLQTHRGHPFCFLSPQDAAARQIKDDQEVLVYNDFGSYLAPVKISSSVRPGQIIFYNGWEPFMHRGWKGGNEVEPGMVKWLHFAAGYGHLRFWPTQWQPVPFDRGVYVDVRPVSEEECQEIERSVAGR
ncbi:MAG TPA: molybdopterin-dependent oxidoreductase [Solirubrobacteraceae bacterium]|nr:molybdopterin-dependent oxidoreductase [Solirubrobacteraceae bacterium]